MEKIKLIAEINGLKRNLTTNEIKSIAEIIDFWINDVGDGFFDYFYDSDLYNAIDDEVGLEIKIKSED